MSTSSRLSVKWHALHCDPIMDVVLLSNDGVYFRASSHALKRESSFFKSMFDSKPNQYQTSAQAIPLDFTADSIAAFLDRYITPGEIILNQDPPASLLSLRDYRDLIRYLDCDRLRSQADSTFAQSCERDPVSWFALASSEDDLLSAKAALTSGILSARGCSWASRLRAKALYESIDRVQVNWRLPLIRALLGPMSSDNTIEVDWPNSNYVARFVKEVEQARAH